MRKALREAIKVPRKTNVEGTDQGTPTETVSPSQPMMARRWSVLSAPMSGSSSLLARTANWRIG